MITPPDVTADPMFGQADGRWHYRRSLASRVTLLTTMAVALSVTIVALGAFITVRMQLQSSLDDSLVERAQKASAALDEVNQLNQNSSTQKYRLAITEVRTWVIGADGQLIFSDTGGGLDFDGNETAVATGESGLSLRTVRDGDTEYRVAAVPIKSSPGLALVVGQSLEPQQHVLTKLGLVTLLFGLAGIIVAGVAGWAVARNGLRPVRRLTAAAEDIARTERLAPIRVEGDDEVARLASAFNQMLASLAASRDRQRRLVADAGHELRTPLTSLRTNIDLLTQAGGDLPADTRTELLTDVRAQLEELSTLVGDLVELARDDPNPHVVSTVELHEVLDHAVARVRRRAPGLTFQVDVEPWYVEGDAAALERALTNLLDNAAKWSPPGGTVRAALRLGVVTVDDEGSGIAEADLPHIFERFYRSSDARAMPGSGLGLSIVAQVAERHAGSVDAGPSPAGGTRLTLRLPGASSPKPAEPPAAVQASAPASSSETLTL